MGEVCRGRGKVSTERFPDGGRGAGQGLLCPNGAADLHRMCVQKERSAV